MSHLPAERLAALADDAAIELTTPRDAAPAVSGSLAPITAEEAAHLAGCAECAQERAAHRALLALAADERARLAPPLTSWGAIAAQLRDEGMLGGVDDGTAAASPSSRVPALAFALTGSSAAAATGGRQRRGTALVASRWGLRAAAAVLLVAGGAVAGRASVGGGGSPTSPLLGVAAAARSAARDSVAAVASSGAGRGIASLVADTMNAFHSTTDALVALARAEHDYQVAAAYILAHDSSAGSGAAQAAGSNGGGDSPGVYRARLAALDNVVAASREALYDAPHDPVINRYYLATVRDREATLQQLNTALPAGARLTRF
ncbi:MAG TPA: hypothetical protein VFJ74_14595 [Gemmatimonadaceae bacterium]|nr:hypothetical protein [Gemmatimonadaceae bacterium]